MYVYLNNYTHLPPISNIFMFPPKSVSTSLHSCTYSCPSICTSAPHLHPAALLERWQQACGVKITSTWPLMNRFVSTATNSIKCLVTFVTGSHWESAFVRGKLNLSQRHLKVEGAELAHPRFSRGEPGEVVLAIIRFVGTCSWARPWGNWTITQYCVNSAKSHHLI